MVLSRVGARGLMQLMPLTATAVAARLGTVAPTPEQLFEPEWSLKLGAAELGRLTRSFDGFTPAAVAAYNAGEAQSRLWIEQCGDNCNEARFVLTITFGVTRGYTEDVLASAETYRRLISNPVEPDPELD
jgi:soluble lytic murein transglycosylase